MSWPSRASAARASDFHGAPLAGETASGAPGLLRVEGLRVALPQGRRWVEVVRGVDLAMARGEMVGLVGESGSGKSTAALALLRLVAPPHRLSGRVLLDGEDLLALPERALRRVRGGRIGMVFQEPLAALNPVLSIGFQVAEAVRAHPRAASRLSRQAARGEALRLLERMAIPEARRRLGDYPHRLSGGQRQRVMLAMALAGGPDLLVADEPTTALDATVQAQILELLGELRAQLGLAVLLISHDLALVAERCGRVVVLYAGQVMEQAPAALLFESPAHPYTRSLLATLPRSGLGTARGRLPVLPGHAARPGDLPSGCAFHPRCADRLAVCSEREPPLITLPAEAGQAAPREVRCWLHAPAEAGGPG